MIEDIKKIKETMKQHLTLKLYIMYIGFSSVFFLAIGELLAGGLLGTFMFLALILHEKYKEKLHLG